MPHPLAAALFEEIFGTPEADLLDLPDGDHLVLAGAGADTVETGLGADTVYGGAGSDVLDGRAGGDKQMFGGDGFDSL